MYYFRTIFIAVFLVVLQNNRSFAQGGISHEVGIFTGPANFLTDYGERWDVQNNIRNAGLGAGVVHFINFAYCYTCNYSRREPFFNKYFRIRNEFAFLRSNLEHYGPIARGSGEAARLLQAMHGTTEVMEIGTGLEYHPLGIRKFTNFGYWFSPYLGLGARIVTYNPKAHSDLGSLEDPQNVFHSFRGGLQMERGSTFSIVGLAGARYRLSWHHDLMFELRLHYYGNDWIDGLDFDAPQNMFNDVVVWAAIGYVYYINFN